VIDIERLSKEQVYNIMSELLYSFNYVWFMFEKFIKSKYPDAFESEEFLKLNEEFGEYEAKRVSKALDISTGEIEDLIRLVKHSHWAVFENIEITKLTKKSFRMRTIECSTQKAAKRWGMEYYDCGLTGSFARIGFYQYLNKNAKIQRIFTPPEISSEETPENVSCEWLISLEE